MRPTKGGPQDYPGPISVALGYGGGGNGGAADIPAVQRPTGRGRSRHGTHSNHGFKIANPNFAGAPESFESRQIARTAASAGGPHP